MVILPPQQASMHRILSNTPLNRRVDGRPIGQDMLTGQHHVYYGVRMLINYVVMAIYCMTEQLKSIVCFKLFICTSVVTKRVHKRCTLFTFTR